MDIDIEIDIMNIHYFYYFFLLFLSLNSAKLCISLFALDFSLKVHTLFSPYTLDNLKQTSCFSFWQCIKACIKSLRISHLGSFENLFSRFNDLLPNALLVSFNSYTSLDWATVKPFLRRIDAEASMQIHSPKQTESIENSKSSNRSIEIGKTSKSNIRGNKSNKLAPISIWTKNVEHVGKLLLRYKQLINIENYMLIPITSKCVHPIFKGLMK